MDTKQIRTILEVAQCLSFSAAARKLNYTPSAVSKHVASAEGELQFPIFFRNAKSKIQLTADGEKLLPYLRDVYNANIALQGYVEQIQAVKNKKLRILQPSSIISLNLDRLFVEYYNHNRDVEMSISVDYSSGGFRRLQCGMLDAIITVLPVDTDTGKPDMSLLTYEFKDYELCFFELEACDTWIAMSSRLPMVRKDELEPLDIAKHHILHRRFPDDTFSQMRIKHFLNIFEVHGITPDITYFEDDDGKFVLNLVSKGLGVLPVLRPTELLNHDIVFKRVRGNPAPMSIGILYIKDSVSPQLRTLLRCAADMKKIT